MKTPPPYGPEDDLYLWMLTRPVQPILVGELSLSRATRGVSLRYDPSWVAHGYPLSEDLPLGADVHLPRERDTAAGAVDDARPDRWGERVIRLLDRPARQAVIDYLYYAGDERSGALGVSTSRERYEPRRIGPLPALEDLDALHEVVRKVLASEPIGEAERRLVSPGVTLGGAQPKALLALDGAPWVVKFDPGGPVDTPLVEHAAMTLAKKADIHVAETRALPLAIGHAVAIRRFDRIPSDGGRAFDRRHVLSANVALRAAGEELGYPELAQLLRRRGVVEGERNVAQMRELFRRMVFNILIDNTHDHEKNHALVVDDGQRYVLSPAYDVLPSGQAIGFQQMRVGDQGADASLDNAMSMCRLFALGKAQAEREIRRVCKVVAGWKKHFAKCGVTASDVEALAEQIDRPYLREQREGY